SYFQHWLNFAEKLPTAGLPRIYGVNWFLQGDKGEFLWPGFGDNMRVLQWIFERVRQRSAARQTEIGLMPGYADMNFDGLEGFDEAAFAKLTTLQRELWIQELALHKSLFESLGERLPETLALKREELLKKFA
ncbi:MAG TPA: phosphoenolpyruvate carboxykinase domain-containing protein, partial [Candidatus Obscuribacter sp.]|nr:phosphoenolpyruvate carboxykinase domain-containing protein [Candidatus Obscuribacter sp.]